VRACACIFESVGVCLGLACENVCENDVLVTEDNGADEGAEWAKRACVRGREKNARHEAGT
jgi:hypothetical protein